MKTYIEQVAEAVRDAVIKAWGREDGVREERFAMYSVNLQAIIASVPTPEPAAEINRQLLDVETKRFLTDVITAAGLLYYGKTDKELSSRINEHAAMLLTATASKQQSQPEKCTNSDSWNCKYCRKTKDCKALNDPRNFANPDNGPVKQAQPEPLTAREIIDIFDKVMVSWCGDVVEASRAILAAAEAKRGA